MGTSRAQRGGSCPHPGSEHPKEAESSPNSALPQFSMEVEEQAAGVDVGRVFVHDKDLAGSPSWLAKFTILEGDPEGAFTIRTDPHTNDGVLSVLKVGRGSWGSHRADGGPRAPLTPCPSRSRWTTRCGTASS